MKLSGLKNIMSKLKFRKITQKFYLLKVSDMKDLIEISHNPSSFLQYDDLVYFKKLNVWGAFKYEVLKDIMLSSSFGISPMHIELNHIYFQKDEIRHQHNKRAAIKQLPFVSKELQFQDNEYTTHIFFKLFEKLPRKETFNFVDEFVNPFVFINALKDLELLDLLNQFNPDNEQFNTQAAIKEIKKIFEQRDYLEYLVKDKLQEGKISPIMQNIIENLSLEEPYTKEDLPKFYTSIVFADAESVASFMTSFIYFLFKYYTDVLGSNDWNKLEELANEILRIYVPTTMAYRTINHDFNYRNKPLKKNDLVVLFLRAANLDDSVFKDPFEIKFGRTEKHLSFGRGKLACIGQFASFRITLNVVKELSNRKESIVFLDKNPIFDTTSMLKIKQLNVLIQ